MYDRDNKDTIWQRTEENMFTDVFDYPFDPANHKPS